MWQYENAPPPKKKKLFKQNKDIFKELDTKELEYFPWESDEVSQIGPYKFTTGRGLEVKNWAGDICVRNMFPREKYRVLLKLITHMLKGVIRRRSEVKKNEEPQVIAFRMKCPEAIHNVRFMAKTIYYLKLYMTLPQFI